MEGRLVLSTIPPINLHHPFVHPLGFEAARPNTPLAPYGAASKLASYIDPSVTIVHGEHVIVGYKDFIGPFASLIAPTGLIKIGSSSSILDNAQIISNPTGAKNPTTSVLIGDTTLISFGATVEGPSTVGAFGTAAKPTEVGENAVINGATVEPGAIIGPLAYVGPGIVIPSGDKVLPGASITTPADLKDPTKVVPAVTADYTLLQQLLANNQALAAGYAQLYQGSSATGISPGVLSTTIFNGNLSAIEGVSAEPGSGNGPAFEPSTAFVPTFIGPSGGQVSGATIDFPARMTGQITVVALHKDFAHALGTRNSIRADEGQPFLFIAPITTGTGVTINWPIPTATANKGNFAFGQGIQIGSHAVLLGSPNAVIGSNVSIGSQAVISGSTIGNGSTIGARAFVSGSTLKPGTNIPAGEILINNKVVGFVQS
jgi:carbonic anhydrase/acetyltransferase-like protein (isoleucine patch superfamily)